MRVLKIFTSILPAANNEVLDIDDDRYVTNQELRDAFLYFLYYLHGLRRLKPDQILMFLEFYDTRRLDLDNKKLYCNSPSSISTN